MTSRLLYGMRINQLNRWVNYGDRVSLVRILKIQFQGLNNSGARFLTRVTKRGNLYVQSMCKP